VKVLHAAAEIAGQASILCRALRDRGIDATALAYNAQYPAYPTDILLPHDGKPPVSRLLGYLGTALRHTGRYDLIHVHFGRSLVPPWNLDLPVHRLLGTPLVFHFHGCDVRRRAMMLERHPGQAACTECDPFCIPERQRRVIAQSARYGASTYVSTPDLLESVPHAEHLPVALDVSAWRDAKASAAGRARGDERIVVLHVPTNRLIKGTRWIEQGVLEAHAHDPRIEWRLLEGAAWSDVRLAMLDADVIVDQVFLGWYGLVAVEAMALGKPVVGFIRPDFEPLARSLGLPLVRTTKERVAAAVLELARDRARRSELGARGVDYALRVHDAPVLAGRLAARYESVLAARSRRGLGAGRGASPGAGPSAGSPS
jgi:glycosyltransferase involved in cell wall biosynthesis